MTPHPLPPRKELNRLFILNRNGDLIWKRRKDASDTWNTRFAGKVAGTIDKRGYRSVIVDGRRRWVHRIIFKIVNGFDALQVDHVNRDKTNSRPRNLRDATISQNRFNRSVPVRSLPRGVYPCGKKFEAKIGKKSSYIGLFDSPQAAYRAFRKEARRRYGEFAKCLTP